MNKNISQNFSSNTSIVILGAGESGIGAALLAKQKGLEVFVSDQNKISEKYKNELISSNIEFEELQHSQEKMLSADLIIKSPGISEKTFIIQEAIKKKIPVISEIEFAAYYTDAKLICITGTNGKTTTTLLTYHLLKEAGYHVGLAGNVGTSFAKQVAFESFDYYVLEISSFQLDGMFQTKAAIAILLNITPDHLDRYGQLENYIDSKFRIIQNMDHNDYFIYYQDDPILKEETKKRKIDQNINTLSISLQDKISSEAFFQKDQLCFNLKDQSFSIHRSDVSLKGKHNYINSMAAVCAALLAGVSESVIRKGLKNFKNAPHRLEFVRKLNDVTFINDSKATNVDAVIYALDSYEQPLIWIAGGVDKGNDYSLLDDLVKKNVKALVCMGVDNSKLKKAFQNKITFIADTHTIQDAIRTAFELASPGDIVLLSPACASFDLFKNYEDRGEQFKKNVLALEKK